MAGGPVHAFLEFFLTHKHRFHHDFTYITQPAHRSMLSCSFIYSAQYSVRATGCLNTYTCTTRAVFTNHSLERSLSYSPEFSMYRSI